MSDLGDIVALLAFLLSCYATWVTVSFNRRQKALIETQEKLNALLLEKEMNEAAEDKKADIGASIIKIGKSSHRLKIWNKGKTTAHNVRIEFPEGDSLVMQRDVEEKFPLESLEQYQSVELVAVVVNGMKRKILVKIIWSDGYKEDNEKLIYVTL